MPICQVVPVGSTICDTIQIISVTQARAMKSDGVDGVARYLETLTSTEVNGLLDAGLGVFGVSYADKFNGTWACQIASGAGLVHGTTLAADLESDHDDAGEVISLLNSYGSYVTFRGYLPCVYNGAGHPLTGEQLGELVPPRYWRSPSNVPTPTLRGKEIGYSLIQHWGDPRDASVKPDRVMRGGVNVDVNTALPDDLGRSLTWTIAA